MEAELEIRLYDRDLTTPVLVDQIGNAGNLTFSTALHGGFGWCDFTIPADLQVLNMWWQTRLFYRLVIIDRKKTVFEGRVEDLAWDGGTLKVACAGYWSSCNDEPYYAAFNANADVIIKAVLTANCPQISADQSNIDALDINIALTLYDDDLTLQELVPKLLDFSDTGLSTWYFAIWEDRIPWLKAKDMTFDWFVEMADLARPNIRISTEKLINRAYTEYEAAGNQARTAEAANATSIAKYGVTKMRAILGQGAVSAAAAQNKRDWTIAEFGNVFAEVSNLVIKGRIADANGAEKPLTWPRAGDAILVKDLLPTIPDLSTPAQNSLNTFFIRETKYDAISNTLTITPDYQSSQLVAALTTNFQRAGRRGIARGIA